MTDQTPADNYQRTRRLVGYVNRRDATPETYRRLGFKSGLEVHQQLKTSRKLFCRCPAGLFQHESYDAEVVRHMRPTLSEMGDYDGTALMEKKTRKNILYRIKDETACTYDIDDTPPFPINREALAIAVRIALMLKLNIVGELHIIRKQYLDGSIPTGFQRTGIIGIEGDIPLSFGTVRIMQLSIEEDSCREVSDIGHWRVYTTDRLGMPLIETVTYPDMKTPDQVAEVAQYIRFLARSSGMVRVGPGAARQDVNVSAEGGTRVEIKGVSKIRWIPELVHNEAFRQRALLLIRDELKQRGCTPSSWSVQTAEINPSTVESGRHPLRNISETDSRVTVINLPRFGGLLSFFTQPDQCFADELSGRVKVIACLERPNLIHSESLDESERTLAINLIDQVHAELGASDDDAQVIVWGPAMDVATAVETIDERCRMAMEGVPNETRKGLPNGTTIFERVLPGPDRMYPDTDSAPIPISEEFIADCGRDLPPAVSDQITQLREWGVPPDTFAYLLRNNLVPQMGAIAADFGVRPAFVGALLGHTLKHVEGRFPEGSMTGERLRELFAFAHERHFGEDMIRMLLPVMYRNPHLSPKAVIQLMGWGMTPPEEIYSRIPQLHEEFERIHTSSDPAARSRWIMGQLRPHAVGNVPLAELRSHVDNVAASV
ncbi:MAG: Glu-tRNA(Gln) amidotransferase subunit GatE [Candidatus Zixiibacteriota bacterium]